MTRIYNDPSSFVADAIGGFCDIYAQYVTAVPGGVVRSTVTAPGKVAVVVGGGSGHYPAFAGYVGPGFADGAVMGDIFASPSTRQVYDVCRLADRGAGVLLSYGNYAGDVLNFGLAAERLRREGIAVETVLVTDDVASAPPAERERRRGVAGDVVVFKIAAAAAEAGHDLATVARLGRRANDATRSLGVAFDGCTLPGAKAPLFTVPDGRMATGLGIHGEPGIEEVPLPSAQALAALLVDSLVKDRPEGCGHQVAVLLNSLGSTTVEELFVLWAAVGPRLRETGLTLVAPEVGELATSLDMAGVSLTVSWLDEQTEPLWTAPAQCPGMRRGAVIDTEPAPAPDISGLDQPVTKWPAADPGSQEAARTVSDLVAAVAAALEDARDELGRIDSVAGDGDHGTGMARGSAAAATAAREAAGHGAGVASTLAAAADAWADRAGGTSGALWGVALQRWSAELSDGSAPDADDHVRGVQAALDGVVGLGGAQPGDKTLVDALIPLVEAFTAAVVDGGDAPSAWRAAAEAATAAADRTSELTPKLGRARPLAERSVGHPDAGAVSLALCARTVASRLTAQIGEGTQHGAGEPHV